ncbi:hypothetical protein [Moorena producens]|uniref:hypothetical protein n=1 Tax=Moorena producens TaxID=1155739 RepID=UPI003C70C83D
MGETPKTALHRCQPCKARVGETTPVAHGGDPQDRTGSPVPLLHRCQSCKARVGETTPVAHGGDPQDRTGSPVPLLHRFYFPHTPHPTPHTLSSLMPCCHPLSPISPSPHLPISHTSLSFPTPYSLDSSTEYNRINLTPS